jgi:PAS domain S-box-containing protein
LSTGKAALRTRVEEFAPSIIGSSIFTLTLIVGHVSLKLQTDGFGSLWPVAGFGVGAVVAALAKNGYPRAVAGGYACALIAIHLVDGRPWAPATVLVVAQLIEAIVAALLIRRVLGLSLRIDNPNRVAGFLLIAIAVPAAVAILAAAGLRMTGDGGATFGQFWWAWASTHPAGIATLAPAVMLTSQALDRPPRPTWSQFALMSGLVILLLALIGSPIPETSYLMLANIILLVPFGWWAAVNASPSRAAMALAIVTGATLALTANGIGIFSGQPAAARVFLAAVAVILLMIGTRRTEQAAVHKAEGVTLADFANRRAQIVLVPLVLFAAFAWWAWRDVDREAREQVRRVTEALATHAQRVVEVQETMLEAVLATTRGKSAEALGQDRALHDLLRHLEQQSPTSLAMAVASIDTGSLVALGAQFPAPRMDMMGREYMAAHRDRKLISHIGGIVRTPVSNRQGFTVSRMSPGAPFVASSLVDLDEFRKFYAGQIGSAGDLVLLARNDGTVLSTWPEQGAETDLPLDAPIMQLMSGRMVDPMRIKMRDGTLRVVAVRPLSGHAVSAAYGYPVSRMLADWLSRITPFALITLLGATLLGVWSRRLQLSVAETMEARGRANVQRAIADLTRRSEARLRESHETASRLAAIVSSSSDAIVGKSLDGTVTSWNEGAERMFGFPASEIVGQSIRAIIPADRLHEEDEFLDVISRGEQVENCETLRRCKDGRMIDVSISISPLRNATGELFGASTIARDISERRRAEESLLRSHATYLNLIQNNPFGVFLVDSDFRLAQVSRGAGKLFAGIEPLIGRDYGEIIGIVWREPFASEMTGRFRHTLMSGEPYHQPDSSEQRRDSGAIESYDWRIERVALPDGSHGVVCFFYDLSERKRYEAALRASEQRFRSVFEHAGTGIAISDFAGRFAQCNPSYAQIIGYEPEELIGRDVAELIHPDDRAVHHEQRERLSRGEIESFELVNRSVRRDGGIVWLRWYVSVLRDEADRPTHFLALSTDMSEQRRAEERQHLLMRELAHRGKNLLAVVQSIASRSLSGNVTLAQARAAFQGRLQALARTYGTLTDEAFEGASLEELVRGELEAFADRATVAGPAIMLTARAAQTLALVVHELATNAAKYGALSAAGGRLSVAWSVTGDGDLRIFRLDWTERNGPAAQAPGTRGFGTTLVSSVAGSEFRCKPELTYGPDGFRYVLETRLGLVGRTIHASPLRTRIQSQRLTALYDLWHDDRHGASGLPMFSAFDRARLPEGSSLTVVEVDGSGQIAVMETGRSLTERLERPVADAALAAEDPLGMGESYRRCAREHHPSYEHLRMKFGEGEAVTFERLLVPYADPERKVVTVIGMAVLSGSNERAVTIETAREPQQSTDRLPRI